MTGIRRPPCPTPPGGLLLGHLAESTPLTGNEPKTASEVNPWLSAEPWSARGRKLLRGEESNITNVEETL